MSPENIKYHELAHEIEELAVSDQKMREQHRIGVKKFDEEVDIKSTRRMKEIIAEIGWPTISKVGVTGSYNAWLIVQHTVRDLVFMTECLELMKSFPPIEIDPANIAYLEDRIRVYQGQTQLYGTQAKILNGRYVPSPVENEIEVDVRRSAIGLTPLKEYFEKLNELYSPETYTSTRDN